jgi:hypothetical protein
MMMLMMLMMMLMMMMALSLRRDLLFVPYYFDGMTMG